MPEIVAQAEALAAVSGAELVITNDPAEAVTGAHAVYTDVWASMGQEHEQEKRRADFAGYQVNRKLLAQASGDAIFLHCLPAKRGQEVTDEVMESRAIGGLRSGREPAARPKSITIDVDRLDRP